MYAVPLFIPIVGEPRDRVVGVLKVERRRTKGAKKREPFTKHHLEAFDVIARIMGFAYFHSERQKSLTLADIGHVLIRPLGDVSSTLDLLLLDGRERTKDEVADLESSRQMLRALSHLLRLAKDSHHQPLELDSVDVLRELKLQSAPISVTSGRLIKVQAPGPFPRMTLNKRAYAALVNIVVNLLHNATQAAPASSEVTLSLLQDGESITVRIENPGTPVSESTLADARNNVEQQSFRGLPRSYQLAERNGWSLTYRYAGQMNVFELNLLPHRVTQ
jgi:signal transduction histidine kinase